MERQKPRGEGKARQFDRVLPEAPLLSLVDSYLKVTEILGRPNLRESTRQTCKNVQVYFLGKMTDVERQELSERVPHIEEQ